MRQLERYFNQLPFKSKRVLLVDDEEDLGWTMKEIFREAGHSLICATSAREGMEKFKNSKDLDIAIIDLRLKDGNGLNFVKRAREANGKVRFVMVSAFGSPEVRLEARQLGASHFLDKPLRPERLLEIINHD